MNNTDDNLEKILKKMGFTESQWDVYTSEVAKIESQGSGGYAARGGSGFHYDGKYQLGRDAKNDAIRLLKKLEIPVPKSLKTHESFYDDTEGSSRSDFRNSSEAQELAFAAFTLANHMSLSGSENYKNKAAKEKLEILGIAHNQGAGKTEKWLSDPETNLRDAFGTNAKKYSNAIKTAFAAVNPPFAAVNPPHYDGVEPDFTLDYDAKLEEVENTKQVQKKLNEFYGNLNLVVDGFWGENTRDAIKRYQEDKRLEVSGKLNPELLSSLGISVAEMDAAKEMAKQVTEAEKVKSMIADDARLARLKQIESMLQGQPDAPPTEAGLEAIRRGITAAQPNVDAHGIGLPTRPNNRFYTGPGSYEMFPFPVPREKPFFGFTPIQNPPELFGNVDPSFNETMALLFNMLEKENPGR